VLVRVRDHGPGIDPDDRARIFERFVRGKNASEAQVRGSGIGLALVKHIAESHGGTVSRARSPTTAGERVRGPIRAARPSPAATGRARASASAASSFATAAVFGRHGGLSRAEAVDPMADQLRLLSV
jgi:two-component system phosphate regulon sensor histidine kinase PhoR